MNVSLRIKRLIFKTKTYSLPFWPQFYHINKEKYALYNLLPKFSKCIYFSFYLYFFSRGKDNIVFFSFIYFSLLPKQFHTLLENIWKTQKRKKNLYPLHSILVYCCHSFFNLLVKMYIHSFFFFCIFIQL